MRSVVNVGASGGRNEDLIDSLRCRLVIGRRDHDQILQNQPSHVVRFGIFRHSSRKAQYFLGCLVWTPGSSSICYSSGGGVDRSPLPF
jgi:hypothetical protein